MLFCFRFLVSSGPFTVVFRRRQPLALSPKPRSASEESAMRSPLNAKVLEAKSLSRLSECEFKPNRNTRRQGNVRECSTGAEAGTFPKDGENIRSSELSEDLVKPSRDTAVSSFLPLLWPSSVVNCSLVLRAACAAVCDCYRFHSYHPPSFSATIRAVALALAVWLGREVTIPAAIVSRTGLVHAATAIMIVTRIGFDHALVRRAP